jgi:signal transduction histidine kinase
MRNAGEAMPAGGRLRVALAVEEGTAAAPRGYRVEIADSGEGIDPANLTHVFEPFFSTKQGGTGLGLALTQQIVVEHGGTISVDSKKGEGTTFTIRVPTAPTDTQRDSRSVSEAA